MFTSENNFTHGYNLGAKRGFLLKKSFNKSVTRSLTCGMPSKTTSSIQNLDRKSSWRKGFLNAKQPTDKKRCTLTQSTSRSHCQENKITEKKNLDNTKSIDSLEKNNYPLKAKNTKKISSSSALLFESNCDGPKTFCGLVVTNNRPTKEQDTSLEGDKSEDISVLPSSHGEFLIKERNSRLLRKTPEEKEYLHENKSPFHSSDQEHDCSYLNKVSLLHATHEGFEEKTKNKIDTSNLEVLTNAVVNKSALKKPLIVDVSSEKQAVSGNIQLMKEKTDQTCSDKQKRSIKNTPKCVSCTTKCTLKNIDKRILHVEESCFSNQVPFQFPTSLSLFLSQLKKEQSKWKSSMDETNGRTPGTARTGQLCSKLNERKMNKMICDFFEKWMVVNNAIQEGNNDTLDITAHIFFIWDTTLESIAVKAKDKSFWGASGLKLSSIVSNPMDDLSLLYNCFTPAILLGLFIMNHFPIDAWNTLSHIIKSGNSYENDDDKNNESKRKRLQMLGATVLIKIQLYLWLNTTPLFSCGFKDREIVVFNNLNGKNTLFDVFTHIPHAILPILLTLVLPTAVSIVKSFSGKRTLLCVICADVAFCILDLVATIEGNHDKNLSLNLQKTTSDDIPPYLWLNTIPVIESLLENIRLWIEEEKVSDDCITSIRSNFVSTRKSCCLAVINDWVLVLSTVKSICNYQFTHSTTNSISLERARDMLCNELAGVFVSREKSTNHESDSFRFGGIALTLCIDGPSSNGLEAHNVASALEIAKGYKDNKCTKISIHDDVKCDEAIILRGFCSWAASKRNLRNLYRNKSSINQIEIRNYFDQNCITMLCLTSERCIDLATVSLNRLWSDNSCLPNDVEEFQEPDPIIPSNSSIPLSFQTILEQLETLSVSLKSEITNQKVTQFEPSKKVLCCLATRILLQKPKTLLPYLLSRSKIEDSIVEILSLLLEAQYDLSEDTLNAVGKHLIPLLETNSHLQKKIKRKPKMLNNVSLEVSVRSLLHILQSRTASDFAKNCASIVLASVIEKSSKLNSDDITKQIISVLTTIDNEVSINQKSPEMMQSSESLPRPSARICLKYGNIWRKSLLTSHSCEEDGYCKIVLAAATNLFQQPSNEVSLSFFGAIIGNSIPNDQLSLSTSLRSRLCIAVFNVIETILGRVKNDMNNDPTKTEGNMFIKKDLVYRLCPLLLLRRIPHSYFRLLYNDSVANQRILYSLANFFLTKLGLYAHFDAGVKTPEERRLLCELAGRCIPFSIPRNDFIKDQLTYSCFEVICKPAFDMISTLHSSQNKSESVQDDFETPLSTWYKWARNSLFAACVSVPLIIDEDSSVGLVATIKFSFLVLIIDVTVQKDCNYDDIIQLQTGCIEFFVLCLMTYIKRRTSRLKSASKSLIEEICNDSKDQPILFAKPILSPMPCFNVLGNLLKSILQFFIRGSEIDNFLWVFPSDFKNQNLSFKICLLNSLTIATQRCGLENGELDNLSSLSVHIIIDWFLKGNTEEHFQYPLCIAASLQFIFNVITRTKSFKHLSSNQAFIQKTVLSLFKMLVNVMNRGNHQDDLYAIGVMRVASLKLLLAIITIDQSSICSYTTGSIGFLAPGDFGRTLNILKGAANVDENDCVRELASHVLKLLNQQVFLPKVSIK